MLPPTLTATRDLGLRWLLDADIDDCFPSIDHARLISLLRARIDDEGILALLTVWTGARRPHPARGWRWGCPRRRCSATSTCTNWITVAAARLAHRALC
jgi:hypothetical protein